MGPKHPGTTLQEYLQQLMWEDVSKLSTGNILRSLLFQSRVDAVYIHRGLEYNQGLLVVLQYASFEGEFGHIVN